MESKIDLKKIIFFFNFRFDVASVHWFNCKWIVFAALLWWERWRRWTKLVNIQYAMLNAQWVWFPSAKDGRCENASHETKSISRSITSVFLFHFYLMLTASPSIQQIHSLLRPRVWCCNLPHSNGIFFFNLYSICWSNHYGHRHRDSVKWLASEQFTAHCNMQWWMV